MKRTRLYSILFNKCPRCHKGSFFIDNNPYHLSSFTKMHEECPVCHESFTRETGFYYGAMYASYGLTVAFGLGLFLFMVVLLHADVLTFLITFTLSMIALMPILYRTSRRVWINLFVGPKKK